jgi:hypothetical protein
VPAAAGGRREEPRNRTGRPALAAPVPIYCFEGNPCPKEPSLGTTLGAVRSCGPESREKRGAAGWRRTYSRRPSPLLRLHCGFPPCQPLVYPLIAAVAVSRRGGALAVGSPPRTCLQPLRCDHPAKAGEGDQRRDQRDARPVDRRPQQPGTRRPHASHTADVISQTRRTASRTRFGHLRSTRFRGPESGQKGSWPESGPS